MASADDVRDGVILALVVVIIGFIVVLYLKGKNLSDMLKGAFDWFSALWKSVTDSTEKLLETHPSGTYFMGRGDGAQPEAKSEAQIRTGIDENGLPTPEDPEEE